MNSKRWQDHFSEEYKNLEQSYSVAESGVSMLTYAIDKQIILESSYFEWALQNFEIPLLKVSYFGDNPASTHIWEKYRSAHAWSLDCLPISEWEGHLYVACLEPTEFPADMKVILILCPISGLHQLWQKYQTSMSFELMDDVPPCETTFGDSVEESLELAVPPEEMLEGLLASPAPVLLEKTGISSQPVLQKSETLITAIATPTELKPETNVALSSQLESEVNILSPVANLPKAPPTTRPPSAVTAITTISPLIAEAPTTVGIASQLEEYFLGTIEKGGPQKFKDNCASLFARLNEFFPKSLILGTDHKLQNVKVIAWDQKSTENKLASPTDMRASSIFRIVESTQKSFHGPIVANDISMKFFSDWNQQQIPDNVTIVPILHSDKVIAMVLCIGDRSHYTRASLQFAERATQEFNSQIIPGSANAA